jgi:hypothetical protein
MPIHSLHMTYQDVLKVRRFLRNYFPDQDKFNEFIRGGLDLSHINQEKTLVHQQQLKNLITNLFDKFQYSISTRSLERFFSFFDTNDTEKVNLAQIGALVYKESEQEFIMRAQKRLKGPPPVYFAEDLKVIDLDLEEKRLKK